MADKNKEWVDYKEVKEKVTMQMVLDRYNIKLHPVGDELRGACPIHKGTGKQFSVNVKKNAFQCFYAGCKAKGNVLDFLAAMEHCTVRDAALKLAKWFQVGELVEPSDAREGVIALLGKTEIAGGFMPDLMPTAAQLDEMIAWYEQKNEELNKALTINWRTLTTLRILKAKK
jgi:hypothetical protein